MAKPKKEQFFTPIGVFKYAHLNKPDTRYKEDGEFSVTVALDKDDEATAAFIKQIDKLTAQQQEAADEGWENASPKQKAAWKKKGIEEPTLMPAYEDELDEDGDPTGRVLFKFKTKASFTNKEGKTVKKVVTLVDGRGQVIPSKKRPLVYAGTEGRVAFSVGAAFIAKDAECFLSFYLNQVQITKLATGGGGTSAFGAVEGSDFSADDLDDYDPREDDEDDDATDGDDGDDDDLDDDIPF